MDTMEFLFLYFFVLGIIGAIVFGVIASNLGLNPVAAALAGFFFGVFAFWAIVCGVIASNQGRNPVAAALAGFFFGGFAFIGYLIAGDTVEAKARKYLELQQHIQAYSVQFPQQPQATYAAPKDNAQTERDRHGGLGY